MPDPHGAVAQQPPIILRHTGSRIILPRHTLVFLSQTADNMRCSSSSIPPNLSRHQRFVEMGMSDKDTGTPSPDINKERPCVARILFSSAAYVRDRTK